MSKTIFCQGNTCQTTKQGVCIECDFIPVAHGVSTANPWDSGYTGYFGKPSHNRDSTCATSTTQCSPGTREQAAFMDNFKAF